MAIKQLALGHINVLYDGTKDMGVHVINGQGCREYETSKDIFALLIG